MKITKRQLSKLILEFLDADRRGIDIGIGEPPEPPEDDPGDGRPERPYNKWLKAYRAMQSKLIPGLIQFWAEEPSGNMEQGIVDALYGPEMQIVIRGPFEDDPNDELPDIFFEILTDNTFDVALHKNKDKDRSQMISNFVSMMLAINPESSSSAFKFDDFLEWVSGEFDGSEEKISLFADVISAMMNKNPMWNRLFLGEEI